VAAASFVVPWALLQDVTTYTLSETLNAKALWAASWPIAIGLLLALFARRLDASIPRIPEGDVIVLVERLEPVLARLGNSLERTDAMLRRWPAASLVLLILVIAFSMGLSVN
jgi:hypothetical protein